MGPAESCSRESNCGTASTTSATAVGSAAAGAGQARDHASRSATQPRSTALSSRSHACSRQPGRVVPAWCSMRPMRRARSQSLRTSGSLSPSAAAARAAASSDSAPGAPCLAAAQWAIATAPVSPALARRASLRRGRSALRRAGRRS
ncbi:hypothetical protein SANTM175S_08958 [Streptomyces antimycoticus]